MKKPLRSTWKKVLLLSWVFFLAPFTGIHAQTICSNTTGSQDGYTYEYWKDYGSGCMTLGSGGTFSIEWSDISNLLARRGVKPGSMDQVVNYGANYQPSGNSYLCVYGWTTNPLVEYYIVDSWGSWRPPGGTSKGTVTTDGGTYEIYETTRYQQPSIQGTQTFQQYWSVRTSKRTSGTITCANHFNAWAGKGMNMGSLYEVSLCVEGYKSSGSANVYSMTMSTGGGNSDGDDSSNDDDSSDGDNYSITVRARGTSGSEQINLSVGGSTVKTWTLGTSMADYTTTTSNSGGIFVEFINDATDRDVQVDYVNAGGTTMQAENQSYNSGVWQDGSCGGSNSEWLHCNGGIGFSAYKGATSDETVTALTGRQVASDVLIFPNPVEDILNISVAPASNGFFDAVIYGTNGVAVKQFSVHAGNNTVDLSELSPGIYIIRIALGDKAITHKIFK